MQKYFVDNLERSFVLIPIKRIEIQHQVYSYTVLKEDVLPYLQYIERDGKRYINNEQKVK